MRLAEQSKLFEAYRRLNIAFGQVFDQKSPNVQVILEDLAMFCRADRPTFHPDNRVHALLEGRREVYLRIQDFMTLGPEQLLAKYSKKIDNQDAPNP